MNVREIMARFDAEMRADPPAEPYSRVEHEDGVVRSVGDEARIEFAAFGNRDVDVVIEHQRRTFQALGHDLEWKVYGHDRPDDLPLRLAAAGFVADPPETFMLFDLSHPLPLDPAIDARRVGDLSTLETFIAVSSSAFDDQPGNRFDMLRRRLGDPTVALFLIRDGDDPACAGRVELPPGRRFASLYGGCTHPDFRGRGLFRALVAARADEARRRGYGFLTVDALPTSAPILAKLGFIPATTITGWVLRCPR